MPANNANKHKLSATNLKLIPPKLILPNNNQHNNLLPKILTTSSKPSTFRKHINKSKPIQLKAQNNKKTPNPIHQSSQNQYQTKPINNKTHQLVPKPNQQVKTNHTK